jgi:hypothetical protein
LKGKTNLPPFLRGDWRVITQQSLKLNPPSIPFRKGGNTNQR